VEPEEAVSVPGPSLLDRLSGQLIRLSGVAEIDPSTPLRLLSDLLGSCGSRLVSEPPAWPSAIADDHTPVEYSLAYGQGQPPALRILAEAFGSPPSVQNNLAATRQFLSRQTQRLGLSVSRLLAVQELFTDDEPYGDFVTWCSLVFRGGKRPELKAYLNPEVKGVARSAGLVSGALARLGLGRSWPAMQDHAVRPGQLGLADRLTFFALDLHDEPGSRVKVYLTHHNAQVEDLVRAASLVDGVDLARLSEFCEVAGGTVRFDRRPLVASYTLGVGSDNPIGYSCYIPIRSYVQDDQEARDRIVALLAPYGYDAAEIDRAVDAVTSRPLRDGVGLIAHVSLRLGRPHPGVTVYLSAEAYGVSPPGQPTTPRRPHG
jgi:DMATS type aromatic prenyltransferase